MWHSTIPPLFPSLPPLPSEGSGGGFLYQWQTDTIYLLIDVECIDICHPTDEVEDCHDTCFKARTLDVILA